MTDEKDPHAECMEPHLGLATTRQLLAEIGARFQMGHEDMDYRTYDGGVKGDFDPNGIMFEKWINQPTEDK
jgi:hypothetical protein